jgi:glucose-1-phosphate adenylyltransferase
MPKVISLVLGGGRGTRLYPLTKSRSKPAVPMAGKYRLIDIPIANCLYSDLNRIFVLTQFNSVSLNRHISRTYTFDPFGGGFVEILAAQQTQADEGWYQGTADAVRRNIPYFAGGDYDLVLILSGDQLYRMNFQDMIRTHLENKAEVTIAIKPVDEASATACGIMKLDGKGRVVDFLEKPKTREQLDGVRTDPGWIERFGISAEGRPYLASMGIYLFNRTTLVDMLASSEATDFGKELFPEAIPHHHVQAHLFDGYWEDIGTVGAFLQANLDLTNDHPPFEFAASNYTIFTRPRYLPCTRIAGAQIRESLISDGVIVGLGCKIENSIIGVRGRIADNVTIKDSYIMGADEVEDPEDLRANEQAGRPHIGIGAGTVIERAIIDKNARIGANVRIINPQKLVDSEESPQYVIRDGVVVIPKFTIIPDGTVI